MGSFADHVAAAAAARITDMCIADSLTLASAMRMGEWPEEGCQETKASTDAMRVPAVRQAVTRSTGGPLRDEIE